MPGNQWGKSIKKTILLRLAQLKVLVHSKFCLDVVDYPGIFCIVGLPLFEAWCSACEFVVGAGEIRLIGASLKLRVSFF